VQECLKKSAKVCRSNVCEDKWKISDKKRDSSSSLSKDVLPSMGDRGLCLFDKFFVQLFH